MISSATDAVIIGAGPAGLATALALQAKGIDCIVVDQKGRNIDKACGEGLMPDALECLALLGLTIRPEDSAPFHGIRFSDAHSAVTARFGTGVGLGVKRTVLHGILVRRASDSGIPIVWGTKPEIMDGQRIRIGDSIVKTKWLIGADGQVSPVRTFFGLQQTERLDTRYGLRRHFDMKPWTDNVEVHWSDIGQMYVTPVAEKQVCFAFVSRHPQLRFDQALLLFPELLQRTQSAKSQSTDRGSLTTTRRLRRITHENVALIGDASGSVDAVTGEGLAMSFRQALALAQALVHNDLKQYEREHRRILKLPTIMASTLLLLDRHPKLRERALRAMANCPESFSRMLSVHLGHDNLWKVAFEQGPRLSWNLVRMHV